MKRILIVSALTAIAASSALAANVGVSINIGEPGFYGRIDLGGFPAPQIINPQAIAIERVPMNRPPIYLRVPPDHVKHWRQHCNEYHACGERVLFVQDKWYTHEYAPRYNATRRGGFKDDHHEDHRQERREVRRDDRPHEEHGREH